MERQRPRPGEPQWRLTIGEKKRILSTHIYGVDIDAQAVEVSKLSLLLKVLEGETDESLTKQQQRELFEDRALPNLADNIKCGNSLIGPDYFTGKLIGDSEEMKRVNPFDWKQGFPDAMKAGGFDCIIGNPPYLFITEVPEQDRMYYQDKYKTVAYRFDLYGVFVEKALTYLLRRKGLFGFIIPHTLLSNDSFQALRSLLATKAWLYQIVDLGPGAFQDAKNETMMLFLRELRAQRREQDRSRPAQRQRISASEHRGSSRRREHGHPVTGKHGLCGRQVVTSQS